MIRVLLTAIPAGIVYDKPTKPQLKVNVLVTFKPPLNGQAEPAPDQKIQLDQFTALDTYKKFPDWITAVMTNLRVVMAPDGNPTAFTNKVFAPPKTIISRSGEHQLAMKWLSLFTPTVIDKIKVLLDNDLVKRSHYNQQNLKTLTKANQSDLNNLNQTQQQESDERGKIQDEIDKLTRRSPRIDRLISQLDDRQQRLRQEIADLKLNLADPDLRTYLDQLADFEAKADQYKARKGTDTNRLKTLNDRLDKLTGTMETRAVKISAQQRLQDDLDKLNKRNGALGYNDDDVKKANQDIDFLRKISNSPAPVEPTQPESVLTSNLATPPVVYLNDLLGYFMNYPSLTDQLGLLHTFTLDLDMPALALMAQQGSGTIQLQAGGGAFPGADVFSLIETPLRTHYEFFKFRFEDGADELFYFMAAPDPDPAKVAAHFQRGFLNLNLKTKEDGKDVQHYELFQNNPLQFRYNRKDLIEGKFTDHTDGFFLVKIAPSAALEKPRIPTTDIYLDDLLIGFRVDMKRTVPGRPGASKSGKWHSLHRRAGKLTMGTIGEVEVGEEGWISREAMVEVKKRVFVAAVGQDGKADINRSVPLNLFSLAKGSYKIAHIDNINNLNDPKNVLLTTLVILSDDPTQPGDGWIRIHKDDSFIPASINALNNILKTWYIEQTHFIQCNDEGDFYYDVYEIEHPDQDDDTKIEKLNYSASAFLPSSVLCAINGNSLSVPVTLSSVLKTEFDRIKRLEQDANRKKALDAASAEAINLVDYLNACNISLGELKPPAGSLCALRLNDEYAVRCRLTTLDGTSLRWDAIPSQTDTTSYHISKTYLRQDNISAPKLILLEDIYEDRKSKKLDSDHLGESEYQIVLKAGGTKRARLICPPAISWQLAEWSKMMDTGNLPDNGKIETFCTQYMPQYSPINGNYVWKKNGKFPEWQAWGSITGIPYIPDPMAVYFSIIPTLRNRRTAISNHDPYSLTGVGFYYKNIVTPENLIFWRLYIQNAVSAADAGWTYDPPQRVGGVYKSNLYLKIQPGEDIEFYLRCSPVLPVSAMAFSHYYAPSDDIKKKAINDFYGHRPSSYPIFMGEKTIRVIHATLDHNYPWFIGQPNDPQPIEASRAGLGDPNLVRIKTMAYFPGLACDQLQLYAQWTDIIDDVDTRTAADILKDPDKNPLTLRTTNQMVYDFFSKEAAASLLKAMNPDYDPNTEDRIVYDNVKNFPIDIIHSLPDSRSRVVRYWFKTRNRFLPFFPIDQKDSSDMKLVDEENKIKSKWAPCRVRSSLPPPPPVVSHIIPIYRWDKNDPAGQGSGTDMRYGNTLRVYLQRPWFATGAGEMLAVVLPNNAAAGHTGSDAFGRAEPYVSTWGSDLTATPDSHLPMMTLADVKCSRVAENIPLDYPQFKIDVGIQHRNVNADFSVALFDVKFSVTKNMWYADIPLNMPAGAFAPFVRLALARYQPFAERDQGLSTVVFTDYTQLQPERTVSVKTDVAGINLSVSPSIFGGSVQKRKDVTKCKAWLIAKDDFRSGENDIFYDQGKIIGKSQQELIYNNDAWTCSFPKEWYKGSNGVAIVLKEYEDFTNSDVPNERLIFGDIIHF